MTAIPSIFAQTFFVDGNVNPDGVFIHSVDVCFAFKDDNLPITLQLRSVVDGYPSPTTIYHNGQATLFPGEIPTTDGANTLPDVADSTKAARFIFDSPVYLPPGEHSLVFSTASTMYFIYMAKIQDPLIGTSRAFSSQAYVGNLFRAQNSDAWAPYINQCIMFKLNRCVFNTTTVSSVEFDVVAPLATANANMDVFQLSVNDISFGKTGIEYSFKSTDTTGALATTATSIQVNQNYMPATRQVLTTANSSLKVFSTMSTQTDFVSPILDPTRINVTAVENIINNGGLANSLAQITNAGVYVLAGGTGNVTATISAPDASGGTQAVATGVVVGNVMTNVVFSECGTGYYTTPTITFASASGATTNATAIITGETGTIGGNSLARYITRKVVLNDGFDARDLQVFLTANRQVGTDVQVYYKVLSTQDPDQNFANKSWSRMVLGTNKNVYAQTSLDVNEYKFVSNASTQVPPTNITYTNSGGTFTTFKSFAIKICLYSSSTVKVPWIRDLRGIAVA